MTETTKISANANKIKVSLKTLLARIVRHEKADNIFFRISRTYNRDTLDYYGVDLHRNTIVYALGHSQLEEWSRENKHLKPYEVIAE